MEGSTYGQAPLATLVREVIRDRCGEALRLRDVAGHLGVSPRTLQRALAAAGTDFTVELQRQRARRAASLLVRGVSVSQTSRGCGYASVSHFSSTVFPAWFGMSPTAFRAMTRLYGTQRRSLRDKRNARSDELALLALEEVVLRQGGDLAERLGRLRPDARRLFLARAEEMS